jgi:hypothetical protein
MLHIKSGSSKKNLNIFADLFIALAEEQGCNAMTNLKSLSYKGALIRHISGDPEWGSHHRTLRFGLLQKKLALLKCALIHFLEAIMFLAHLCNVYVYLVLLLTPTPTGCFISPLHTFGSRSILFLAPTPSLVRIPRFAGTSSLLLIPLAEVLKHLAQLLQLSYIIIAPGIQSNK